MSVENIRIEPVNEHTGVKLTGLDRDQAKAATVAIYNDY